MDGFSHVGRVTGTLKFRGPNGVVGEQDRSTQIKSIGPWQPTQQSGQRPTGTVGSHTADGFSHRRIGLAEKQNRGFLSVHGLAIMGAAWG